MPKLSQKLEIWKIGQPRIPVKQAHPKKQEGQPKPFKTNKLIKKSENAVENKSNTWPIYLARTLEQAADQQHPSYRKEMKPKPGIVIFSATQNYKTKSNKKQTFPRRTDQLLKDKSADPRVRRKLTRSKTLGMIGTGKDDLRMRRLSTQDNMRAELLK